MKFIEYPSWVKRTWLFLFKLGAAGGCHQLPERSFRIADAQFPVCARCTGVYLGQIIAIPIFLNFSILNLYICLLFLLIMFLDWFIQYLKIRESTNFRRFITGALAGIGLTGFYIDVFIFIYKLIFKG